MENTFNLEYYVFQQSIMNVIMQSKLSKFVISDVLYNIGSKQRELAYNELTKQIRAKDDKENDSTSTDKQ